MNGTISTSVTPIDPAAKALAEASSDTLLDSIVQLTHKIHGLDHDAHPMRLFELREQRRLVREEVHRRLRGAR